MGAIIAKALIYFAIAAAIVATLTCVACLLVILHRRRTGRFAGAALLPSLTALILAGPCLFLGFVAGGDIGGGVMDIVGTKMGMGEALVPLGIGFGIWFASTLPEVLLVGILGIVVLRPTARKSS